jgi:Tol biopolymer transport system component
MKQVTADNQNHILSNAGVWSPDGEWIVYDVRSDRLGSQFDGTRIERVHVTSGRVEVLYESREGAYCGVATYSPVEEKVVFIAGPERPTPDWQYSAFNRRGVMIETCRPGVLIDLDARELLPPFLPGALRGGTHLHLFGGDGQSVSFTYEDYLLATGRGEEPNQRNVGITMLGRPVQASRRHPRNHDGSGFSVLATQTAAKPTPRSDQIAGAAEEAWIGINGYVKLDGMRQRRAIAFQGEIVTSAGVRLLEAFIVDIPEDLTIAGDEPLEGTPTTRPRPPKGTAQRRLTFTEERKFPGLAGPRHWLRSNRQGTEIGLLMRDDAGVVQFFCVSPTGGEPRQITRTPWSIASAFTWSPGGGRIACVMDNSVFVTDVASGKSERWTERTDDASALLPLACVFSPNGKLVAYLQNLRGNNQILVAPEPGDRLSALFAKCERRLAP